MDAPNAFALAAHDILPGLTAQLRTVTRHPNFPFIFLFTFRYLRLIVHVVAFWLYKPAPIPDDPGLYPADCTVIIPTVEPENEGFHECLASVLSNSPGAVLIVTVGKASRRVVRRIIAPLQVAYPCVKFQVTSTEIANKRRQVCHAIPAVSTQITVLVDDHVFWPSTNCLRSIVAPFEDPQVGVVGTNKRVRHLETGFGLRAFWNMIGALYLERHNFEIRATNAVDGGVFVISGRTSAHRSCILQDPEFLDGFMNERFFFGMYRPLNADDDNFITRWEVRHGWKVKIQYTEDSRIETTLGTWPKFQQQYIRWAQTTWRSNSASLFTDRTVWRAQPWCVYAVYFTSFFNFALFTDAALVYTLTTTTFGGTTALKTLAIWIFLTKMVKPFPYFLRHPTNLIYLPGYILFGYYHSFIKLYALFTFRDCVWRGRDLSAINGDDDSGDGDDSDDEPRLPCGGTLHYPDASLSGDDSNHDCTSSSHFTLSRNSHNGYNRLFKKIKWRPGFRKTVCAALKGTKPTIATPWGVSTGTNSNIRLTDVLESQTSLCRKSLAKTPTKKVEELGLPTPPSTGNFRRNAIPAAIFDSSMQSLPEEVAEGNAPGPKHVYSREWVRG